MIRGRINYHIIYTGIFIIILCLYFIINKAEGFKNKITGKEGNTIKFGILAIFKNEAMVLEEWIEHYLWQGADIIVLLDNNSTDNFKSITSKYRNKVHVLHAAKNHVQGENYAKIGFPYLKTHNVDVVGIFDIDEYMFGTDGKNLKEHVIETFGKPDRPSQFSCHWNMFNSSGLENQPESIRKSFTWKHNKLDKDIKSVSWFNDILPGDNGKMPIQHQVKVSGKTIGCPTGLQLNHYVVMSKEYFEKVKMSRGAVDTTNNVRDWNYFYNHVKQPLVEDVTLANLVKAI